MLPLITFNRLGNDTQITTYFSLVVQARFRHCLKNTQVASDNEMHTDVLIAFADEWATGTHLQYQTHVNLFTRPERNKHKTEQWTSSELSGKIHLNKFNVVL